MTTKFGKITKKIRIDNDEILGDMAAKIGVSSAFLSKVENGVSKPSARLVSKLIEKYDLSEEKRIELEEAAFEQKNDGLFGFSKLTTDKKKAAVCFAQALPNLSNDKLEIIMEMLESKE